MCSRKNNSCLGPSEASQRCTITVGNSICGEANSLDIMKEFNRLYEERMEQVDSDAGGDCLQEKVRLQSEWIKNLIQQNEMLVKAVQELEIEATERVQHLEEKLQKSAESLCQGEKMLNEKERTVHELTQRVNYYNSFGDLEALAKELQSRRIECDTLKQDMIDIRQALTEEVALKYDQIIALRKDVQILEDRCLQADEQTAFKEDIIRELRKEIKQLKQQFTHDEISKLNLTIDELRHNLEKTRMIQEDEEKAHENEISMLQSTIDNLEQNIKILKEKYEKDTKTCKICRGRSKVGFLETSEVQVNIESKESELLKVANDLKSNMKLEIDKKDSEIQCLKNKVSELEQTANLQETVANELKSNMKIEADKKNAEIRSLKNKITELEVALTTCEERAANLQEADQLKKLSKQKKCYEDIIGYFKNEMAVMAEQLNNLQELLTLSNASAHQESSKIMQAFMEVQTINEKLSNQLCACEQKVQLESQMNQIHEAKICELQQLVSEKEINLSKHDETMLNIRKTLNDSLKQNADLQLTIVELNETINSLQDAIKTYEYENCASKRSCLEFQQQIGSYCCKLEDVKKDLEDKTAECLKLEMAYNNEKRALKAAQKQLQETERLQQENQRELVSSVEEMKEKLQQGEDSIKKLCCECENLQGQLANLSRKEAVKDLEIKRYRKIVTDLKTTMMELNTELNKNLAQKDIKSTCKNASCRKNFDKDETKPQDICLSCPCEVEFYQKMVDMLKKSVTELKRKLSDTQEANKALEEQLREKSSQLAQALKAKEELERRLSFGQLNDRRICELECENDRLKQELQMKSLQLTDVKRSANEINESKCMQLACAQEEISNLKNDMTNILNRQYNLKRENEELQSQMAELNCNNNCLNEKNKMLKEQIEQNLMRIKNLNAEKETLLRKNKELVYELRSFQSMTCTTDKHHRDTPCPIQRPPARISKSNRAGPCNNMCASPCSLGSQGVASFYDEESPIPSPDLGMNNDWYSTTFRAESDDNESEEDYCVNTLEHLTQQMRKSNRFWKSESCRSKKDCRVTKDIKK